jgi:hypothetical protein
MTKRPILCPNCLDSHNFDAYEIDGTFRLICTGCGYVKNTFIEDIHMKEVWRDWRVFAENSFYEVT